MQVSKWGNSLAVRLLAAIVEALDLKETRSKFPLRGSGTSRSLANRSRERALEQLREMKWSFPRDFRFNREEIHER